MLAEENPGESFGIFGPPFSITCLSTHPTRGLAVEVGSAGFGGKIFTEPGQTEWEREGERERKVRLVDV